MNHVTVMAGEVVEALAPVNGGHYVDATVGGGGHSEAILTACPRARVLAFDRDDEALATAGARLSRFSDRVEFVHASFDRMPEELRARHIESIDGLVADLGISTPQ